jgi:Tfp pilus assembly protein PilF
MGVWFWAVVRRKSERVLAGGIYFAGFATTANILIPTGTILGERLAYLPSAGICLLVAVAWMGIFRAARQKRERLWAWTAMAAIVATLGVRTVVRNRDWKDDRALFTAAVHATPNSAKAHNNLGLLYLNGRQPDLAEIEFKAALNIYPDYPDILASYGLLKFQRGDYKEAERMMRQALDTSTRANPNYDFMAVNLAGLWMQTGDNFDAMQLLNREITESPGYARAWANRAVIRYRLGQSDAARADAEAALRLDGSNPQARELMRLLNNATQASASEP